MEHLQIFCTALLALLLALLACQVFWVNFLFGQEMNILNKPSGKESPPQVSATYVDASLQKMILKYCIYVIYRNNYKLNITCLIILSRLKGKYLSEDGKSVDYPALRKDDLFKEFQFQAEQLANIALVDLSLVQRKAFFISIELHIQIMI